MRFFKYKRGIDCMKVLNYNKTIEDYVNEYFNNPLKNIEKDELPMVHFVKYHKDFKTILGYEALCLDFDDNISWIDAKIRMIKFNCEFYMHTTPSHRLFNAKKQSMNGDRFRVIIPLKNIMSESLRIEVKSDLIKLFNGVDPASFNSNQRFYLPVKNNDMFKSYEHKGSKISLGELLGFSNDTALKSSLKLKKFYSKLADHGSIKTIFKREKTSAKNKENVKYFLNTELMTGGNKPLYDAIVSCKACDDIETLNEVVIKAITEKWTKCEIEQKIKCAERFIKTNRYKKGY